MEFSSWVQAWGLVGMLLSLTATGLSIALAGLLFRKRRNEPMGLFLAYFLLVYGIVVCGPLYVLFPYWVPQIPYLDSAFYPFAFVLLLVLMLIFPNGQFLPRWTRVLVPVAAAFSLLTLRLGLEELAKIYTLRAQVVYGVLSGLLILALAIQVYRYRNLYTPIERQQTKWVAYGGLLMSALAIAAAISHLYLVNLPPGSSEPGWALVKDALWALTFSLLPISLTLAIMRSHLWELDILIRRTVTYSLLTALLVIFYFGSILVLQQLFSTFTESGSNEFITVISTLAIAALFVPLRNRVQAVIDRRFNRKKYDAQQVLSKFGETVRDETDLDRLTGRLVEVVNETMQPKSVSLWLKREERGKSRT
jgi:hypothetical protein